MSSEMNIVKLFLTSDYTVQKEMTERTSLTTWLKLGNASYTPHLLPAFHQNIIISKTPLSEYSEEEWCNGC